MRILLTIFFMTLAARVSSFEYEEVYFCGEKLEIDVFAETRVDHWDNFYIHFDKNDAVVILHGGYQYSTLEPRKYDRLYAQNAALTILEIKETIGDIVKFELKNLLNGNKKILVVDFNDLTYLARFSTSTETYAPSYGACKIAWPPKD